MATTANSILKFIDDAATTYNILNSTGIASNYQLTYGSWSPQVATKQTLLISGDALYTAVLETMTLNIVSNTSAADCISKLRAFFNFLDQADRWYQGGYTNAVRVYYQPKGSTLSAPARALVISHATDQAAMLSLPVLFDDVGTNYRINGVVLKFWRMGAWLCDTDIVSLGSTANGGISSIGTLSNGTGVCSPCDLLVSPAFDTTTQPSDIAASVMIIADAISGNSKIVSKRASLLSGGVYTSVADAANKPKFATILRYTPAVTTFVLSGLGTFTTIFSRVIAIYATVRNNSATTQFRIKVRIYVTAAGSNYQETQEVLIDNSTTSPRVVFLGILGIGDTYTSIAVNIAATVASGTLDIDNIVAVGIDDETTSILELPALNITNDVAAGAIVVQVDHNQDALDGTLFVIMPQIPIVRYGGSAGLNIGAIGRLPLMTLTDQKNFCWLMTRSTNWTFCDNGGTIVSMTPSVTRQRAYLIPE